MKHIFLFIVIFLASLFAETKNPVVSPTFDNIVITIVDKEEYIFDDKNIIVKVPNFADNPVQVPIYIDARKIKNAKRLVVFADLNPISQIIDMKLENMLPVVSTNIKVAKETPLRALVQDENNLWHVGSANIKSNGGGCDVSSQASKDYEFAKLLGQTKGQLFTKDDNTTRIKASVFHPMETGLIFGNNEFYINNIQIENNNNILASIQTTSAISENPRFIFETKEKISDLIMKFHDSDGNQFLLDLK